MYWQLHMGAARSLAPVFWLMARSMWSISKSCYIDHRFNQAYPNWQLYAPEYIDTARNTSSEFDDPRVPSKMTMLEHEWYKHGTCAVNAKNQPMDPVTYFQLAFTLAASVMSKYSDDISSTTSGSYMKCYDDSQNELDCTSGEPL